MKKYYSLLFIMMIALLFVTGCGNKGYKMLVKEETALTNLRLSIDESETYGATTLTYEDVDELENLTKNYNKESEWFNSSALSFSGYGKKADNGKTEITSLCDGEYCATFKAEKKKGKYYLTDYTFEKSAEKTNKIYIVTETTGEESQVKKLDMDIKIDKDGTALITETWKANVNEGTEGWHPYFNLGKSNISMISASMDEKEYSIENSWNESSTLTEKAYKAGIYKVDDNEHDVVFGISEYGSHTYKFTYKITNFVSNLSDSDMIYWQLVPYDFGLTPNNITIKVSGPNEYPDTLDVWVYGRKSSIKKVKNGSIYITSNGKISRSEYITVLVKFPSGTFNTTSKLEHDFNYYYDMAN